MNYSLTALPPLLKRFLITYIIILIIGMGVGLVYLYQSTNISKEETIEHINGTEISDEDDFKEKYPKSINELLITTHNHIFGMGFIFFSLGLIFFFSEVNKYLKGFLLIEPLISIVTTFGSIWLVRFVDEKFIYLTIISSLLMYSSFFLICAISLWQLLKKQLIVIK